MHEQLEHLEFLSGEVAAAARRGELEGRLVKADVAERQTAAELGALAAGHGADAREQLRRGKGLGQVVVRAGIQPEHLVLDLGFGGEQEHGDAAAALADAAQHRQPVHFGYHDVEDHGVIISGLEIGKRLLAVEYGVGGIVVLLKQRDHRAGERALVLRQQNPHGRTSVWYGKEETPSPSIREQP